MVDMKNTHRLQPILLAAFLFNIGPALDCPGQIPTLLDPNFVSGPGADNDIFAVISDSSGRLLVAGQFANFGGFPRGHLVRLGTDGSADATYFAGNGANGDVFTVAIQADGRALIGGAFTTVHGENRSYLARLNATGDLDPTFAPVINQDLRAIAIDPTGRILIAGRFTQVAGQSRGHIARLNSDGTLDPTFTPGTGANDNVRTLLLMADGRILIGGQFTSYDGVARTRVARLQSNGRIDESFLPGLGADGQVRAIATNAQAQIYIGGDFRAYDGTAQFGLARLLSNGSLDATFSPGMNESAVVRTIAVQTDGKLWIGGKFFKAGNVARANLARLEPGGQADEFFTPFPVVDNEIFAIKLELPNRVLLAGDFESIDGQPRAHLASIVPNSEVFSYAFSASTDAAVESSGPATIQIQRFGATAQASTVQFRTIDDTAIAGRDFSAVNTTITFAPGETSRTVTIPLLDDTDPEGTEWFTAELSWTQSDPAGGRATKRVYLVDNEFQAVLDDTFLPRFPTGPIYAAVPQPDGKIVIGGEFRFVGSCLKDYLSRLNPNGEDDCSFSVLSTGANGSVNAIVRQSDGRILAGGNFTTFNGQISSYLARVLSDGQSDPGFFVNDKLDGSVQVIQVQPDGRILIGGQFTKHGTTPRPYLARLHPNGALDSSFDAVLNGPVWALLVRPNGQIYVGGEFTTVRGTPRSRVARLQPNGSLDPTFATEMEPNGTVISLAEQPDGRLIVAGNFTVVGPHPRSLIARLNANGRLDESFDVGSLSGLSITSIALQRDGKIVFGGLFSSVAGVPQPHLSRVLSDGTLDTGFLPSSGANGVVRSIQVESDGRILVTGDFTEIAGGTRLHIARLFPEPSLNRIEMVWDELGVRETDGYVEVKARRSGPSTSAVSVEFETLGNTAQAGTDFVPQLGTITFAPFETIKTLQIPIVNDSQPEATESFRIRLFNPAGGAVLGPQTETVITVLDADLGFSISPPNVTVREGTPNVSLLVERHSDGPGPVSVDFSTVNGSAAAGSDYRATHGTLTFLPGETERTIVVPLFNNPEFEGRETFRVILSNPSPGTSLGLNQETEIDLEDQDSAFEFHVLNNLQEGGESVVPCYIFRRGLIAETATVHIRSDGGTATPNADYGPIDQILTFAPGEFLHEIYVTNRNDGLVEPTESIRLTLSEPTGHSIINTSTTNIFIFDNDLGIEFSQPTFFANEFASTARIVVRRGDDGTNAAAIRYTTTDGTALAGADYTGGIGVIVLPPGTTNAIISIPILPDRIPETNEWFQLRLSSVNPGFTIGTQGVAQVVILDDELAGSLDVGFSTNPDEVSPFGLSVAPINLASTPHGELLVGNQFGLLRLLPDGRRDTNFAEQPFFSFFDAVPYVRPDGLILVGGSATNCCFGSAGSPCLRLLDTNGILRPDFSFPYNFGQTEVITMQPNGGILVGGDYFTNGLEISHRALLRVLPNGTVDPGFDAGEFAPKPIVQFQRTPTVQSLALQPDGKILAAGHFTAVAGQPRTNIVRLSPTGSVDPSFRGPSILDTNYPTYPPNSSGYFNSVWLQNDGRILVAGSFTSVNGRPTSGLARLQPNGSPDDSYRPDLEPGWFVSATALQNDGRLLVAMARFDLVAFKYRSQLRRLHPDGSRDESFDAGTPMEGTITSIAILPGGDIAIAGSFPQVNGIDRPLVARLRGDGLFLRTSRETANLVRLELFNTWPGGEIVLESSSNLGPWSPVVTNTAAGPTQSWQLPATAPQTFFRAQHSTRR